MVISSGGDGEIRLWSLGFAPAFGVAFFNPALARRNGRSGGVWSIIWRYRVVDYLASPFVETPLLSFPVRPRGHELLKPISAYWPTRPETAGGLRPS